MSRYEVVIVDVSPVGKVQVKTEGFSGKACLEATDALERSLGAVIKITPTAEMKNEETAQKNTAKKKL